MSHPQHGGWFVQVLPLDTTRIIELTDLGGLAPELHQPYASVILDELRMRVGTRIYASLTPAEQAAFTRALRRSSLAARRWLEGRDADYGVCVEEELRRLCDEYAAEADTIVGLEATLALT